MELLEITGYEAVPEELQKYPNWITYKIETVFDKNGKPKLDSEGNVKRTKKPYTPTTGMLADTTNPETWVDFETAIACESNYDGLGFAFGSSPFVGVDLDDVGDEIKSFEQGDLNNIVGEFHEALQTYMEISPSGNGVHLIVKGKLPAGKRKIGNVEMYDTDRYFTMTGNQLGEYDEVNSNIDKSLERLHAKYLGADNSVIADFSSFEAIPSYGNGLDAEAVLQALKTSKQGDKWIDLLLTGDWNKYSYPSRSDAELAVVSKLGFFSNYDKHVMDEICKSSILIDEKWERPSSPTKVYTIGKVIANRPADGGYKAKNDFDFNIKGKNSEMKQLKENAQPPTIEDFDKKKTNVLPDKNGVLWYLHEFASEREPEVRLVKKYYNYENMASIVTDMIYNEFSEVVEYSIEESYEIVDDPYISEMYRKISQLYIDVPQKDLYHIVNNLGRKCSYHPIKQLIESVEWDKQERIETFFIDYFGLSDTSYHREATRKWFIGAVARVYDPGIKFDIVPIIRGAQGVGKTTAIERLAFELDYYLSLNGEKVNDKDTMQLLRDSWLVELEELEFLSNNTDGSIKKFFSSRDDKYREPYGKNQRNYKRHSVFIGTVNNKSFLTDKTGNRRYYPLVIDDSAQGKYQVFSNLTKDVVHQIWAEALTYYKNKEGLVCSPETESVFDVIRGNVMEEDVTEQTLVDFLNLELPQEYYEATIEQKRLYLNGSGNKNWHIDPALRPDITTREILIECFGREIDADWRGDQSSKRINSIMENLSDWTKSENLKRMGVDGKQKRARGFKRN